MISIMTAVFVLAFLGIIDSDDYLAPGNLLQSFNGVGAVKDDFIVQAS